MDLIYKIKTKIMRGILTNGHKLKVKASVLVEKLKVLLIRLLTF